MAVGLQPVTHCVQTFPGLYAVNHTSHTCPRITPQLATEPENGFDPLACFYEGAWQVRHGSIYIVCLGPCFGCTSLPRSTRSGYEACGRLASKGHLPAFSQLRTPGTLSLPATRGD